MASTHSVALARLERSVSLTPQAIQKRNCAWRRAGVYVVQTGVAGIRLLSLAQTVQFCGVSANGAVGDPNHLRASYASAGR